MQATPRKSTRPQGEEVESAHLHHLATRAVCQCWETSQRGRTKGTIARDTSALDGSRGPPSGFAHPPGLGPPLPLTLLPQSVLGDGRADRVPRGLYVQHPSCLFLTGLLSTCVRHGTRRGQARVSLPVGALSGWWVSLGSSTWLLGGPSA